jgi:NodT family efflux transporter outer membrane factor (OMF) lipoprotein
MSITVLGITITACTPHRVTRNPLPPVAVPEAYGAASSARPLPEEWWREFEDADLDHLVARSLEDNLQLRAAWARLRQASAVVDQAASAKWPQLNLDGSATRQKSRFEMSEPIGEMTTKTNRFSVSLGAAYEVDLWRRVSSQTSAATLDALSVRDDVEAMAMSIAAEIAEAWFDIVVQRAQRKLLVEQLETNEMFLELVQLRFEQGLASALDVYQQKQQVVSTRAQLGLVDGAIEVFGHRLAVLVGQPPRAVVAGERNELPSLPPLPGTGVPANLLERRPDVRAARRRVEAADYRVAVAVADRLPGLRLSGSTSLQDSKITEFIATPLWAILAAVTQSLFDGGRRKAEVERNRAIVEERLMQYGQVLLVAMTEVENALVQERQQLQYISDLEEQVEIARAALREARSRYREGLIDYLPVLTSLQVLQRVELSVLQAQRQLLSHRVQLCRALGGSWTGGLTSPKRGGAS